MKEPVPTRRTRTWAGRSQRKQAASLPANRMMQLAHAVNRAAAIEKANSQAMESTVKPGVEIPPSTVAPPRPLPHPPRPPKGSHSDSTQAVEVATQIEVQAARVEQLSVELRAAMAQLKTMTQQLPLEPPIQVDPEGSSAATQSLPPPEAAIAVVSQSIALPDSLEASLTQSQQNAASTAQLLRQLGHRQKPSDRLRLRREELASPKAKHRVRHRPFKAIRRYRWLRQGHRWISAAVQLPVGMPALLSDAAVWVAIAAAVRVGLQVLLNTLPLLWLPAVLLIAAVIMLATYQATFNPVSGPAWGYRLLLVVAGLLLGGRL